MQGRKTRRRKCANLFPWKKWLRTPRSGEALLLQKADHATASIDVHSVVGVTILYGTKYRSCDDVRSSLHCVDHVGVLPQRPSIGDGCKKMCPSMTGRAMSNHPRCGGDVGCRNGNPEGMVDELVRNGVRDQSLQVVPHGMTNPEVL